jgi:D-aminopeptidase
MDQFIRGGSGYPRAPELMTEEANFTELRINGHAVSEAEVTGLGAASMDVPLAVVTGDDQICEAVAKTFPGVRTVEVKSASRPPIRSAPTKRASVSKRRSARR